jgi:1,2-diacylglycerol 3-alpha-glucosyltransferase
MKIAIFTETFLYDVNGVVSHVKTLRAGLQKLGHEVLIVTADKHCKHHYVDEGILHCPSLEMKRIYGFGLASPYSLKRLRLVKFFDPDIIHVQHEFGIGISGMVAAKLQKKPLVYTLHTAYDQYINYYITIKPFQQVATKALNQYEKFLAETATVLTGPSNKVEEYFKNLQVNNPDINLIPNAADTETFNLQVLTEAEKAERRKKLGIPAQATVLVFAGRLAQEKSVEVLLDYFAGTVTSKDKFHFLIVGDGPALARLKKQAANLKIAKQVTFTGLVTHQEMPSYYTLGDVFVTASLSEMNSMAMLEAMASGLIVLQRYDKLNADQIKVGVNGYLFKNAREFIDKLREIQKLKKGELMQLREQVRASVMNRGAFELAVYMVEVYKKALKKNREKKHETFSWFR